MSRKRKLEEPVEEPVEAPSKRVSISSDFCVVFIMLHSGLSCGSVDKLKFFSLPYNEEYMKGNFASPGCKSIIHYTSEVDDTLATAKIIYDRLVSSRSDSSRKSIMENIMKDIKAKYIENHKTTYQGKDSECALEFQKIKDSGFQLQYSPKCSWLSSFVSNSCDVAIKEYELKLEYGKFSSGKMGYGERIKSKLFESTSMFDDNVTLFFQDGTKVKIVHLLRDKHYLAFINYINKKSWGLTKTTPYNITFTTQDLFDFLREEYPRTQFAFVDGGCSTIMSLSKDEQDKAHESHKKTPFNFGGYHKKSIKRNKGKSNRKSRHRRSKTQKYSKK